jgi:hypothetical protein
MSFQLAPLETVAAEAVTGLFISAGAKGVAATIVKRANATLAVVNAVSQIEAGNTVVGLSSLTAALGSSNLDPGEALALQGFLTQLAQQASLVNSILGATILGTVATTVQANIVTGVTNACNAEIAKYAPPAAPAAA